MTNNKQETKMNYKTEMIAGLIAGLIAFTVLAAVRFTSPEPSLVTGLIGLVSFIALATVRFTSPESSLIAGLIGLVSFTALATLRFTSPEPSLIAGLVCAALAVYSGAVVVVSLLAYGPNSAPTKQSAN